MEDKDKKSAGANGTSMAPPGTYFRKGEILSEDM
jgi:hypothetical protein